jgi:hypothetical protein
MTKQFKVKILALLAGILFSSIPAQAQILSSDTTVIQFTPLKVPDGVTWSRGVSITENGLSSEKLLPNSSAEVWVQSQPISAGMSWRPPTSAKLRLNVEAGTRDFTYLNAYFRYSCDRIHWSTWYNLPSVKPESETSKRNYEGSLSIPRMANDPYYAKMQQWWKTKPVWSSDEHELSVWIVSQDPNFFSREFPFIGYLQVRIEGETSKGLQLKSLSVEVGSAVSGLSSPSKGQGRTTTGEKWFFDASKSRM